MPGGKLHAPIWKPYKLYGEVDHMYGWPAWENNNGFTAAQGSLNLVETIGYMVYLAIVYTQGTEVKIKGRGAPKKLNASEKVAEGVKKLTRARVVGGKEAAWCTTLGFSLSIVTVFKTILYCMLLVFLPEFRRSPLTSETSLARHANGCDQQC